MFNLLKFKKAASGGAVATALTLSGCDYNYVEKKLNEIVSDTTLLNSSIFNENDKEIQIIDQKKIISLSNSSEDFEKINSNESPEVASVKPTATSMKTSSSNSSLTSSHKPSESFPLELDNIISNVSNILPRLTHPNDPQQRSLSFPNFDIFSMPSTPSTASIQTTYIVNPSDSEEYEIVAPDPSLNSSISTWNSLSYKEQSEAVVEYIFQSPVIDKYLPMKREDITQDQQNEFIDQAVELLSDPFLLEKISSKSLLPAGEGINGEYLELKKSNNNNINNINKNINNNFNKLNLNNNSINFSDNSSYSSLSDDSETKINNNLNNSNLNFYSKKNKKINKKKTFKTFKQEWKRLQNKFNCCYCHDVLAAPHIIECSHRFCYSCIEDRKDLLLKQSDDNLSDDSTLSNIFSCPLCINNVSILNKNLINFENDENQLKYIEISQNSLLKIIYDNILEDEINHNIEKIKEYYQNNKLKYENEDITDEISIDNSIEDIKDESLLNIYELKLLKYHNKRNDLLKRINMKNINIPQDYEDSEDDSEEEEEEEENYVLSTLAVVVVFLSIAAITILKRRK